MMPAASASSPLAIDSHSDRATSITFTLLVRGIAPGIETCRRERKRDT